MKRRRNLSFRLLLAPASLFLAQACSDDSATFDPGSSDIVCSISQSELLSGGPGKDGIPALTNPTFVRAGEGGTDYLRDEDRVVGIIVDSEPLALPLNIFWWHEIVNLDEQGPAMSITHCPLTGSTLAFDRSKVGGAEFGVSGLLYRNNLVMYDRTTSGESLWPQMLRGARCGPSDGTNLDMVPVIEMTWVGWRTLHPDTRVISGGTGFGRDYTAYPYGNYDNPDNSSLLFPGKIDDRRPPKERVLGIPLGSGGVAFPFGVLDELGVVAAVSTGILGEPLVVLWDGNRQAAMAYRSILNGEELTFSVVQGQVVDDQTGSIWQVEGLAVDGPMVGQRLEAVSEAFVAFWFSWPSLYPEIEIWGAQ
jgi:hypothetical protein